MLVVPFGLPGGNLLSESASQFEKKQCCEFLIHLKQDGKAGKVIGFLLLSMSVVTAVKTEIG